MTPEEAHKQWEVANDCVGCDEPGPEMFEVEDCPEFAPAELLEFGTRWYDEPIVPFVAGLLLGWLLR